MSSTCRAEFGSAAEGHLSHCPTSQSMETQRAIGVRSSCRVGSASGPFHHKDDAPVNIAFQCVQLMFDVFRSPQLTCPETLRELTARVRGLVSCVSEKSDFLEASFQSRIIASRV